AGHATIMFTAEYVPNALSAQCTLTTPARRQWRHSRSPAVVAQPVADAAGDGIFFFYTRKRNAVYGAALPN
ncbi:hypothetical protein BaRGS_00000293, partial [Batillaria attramentaria]